MFFFLMIIEGLHYVPFSLQNPSFNHTIKTILKGLNLFGCVLTIIYPLTCVISACDATSLNLKTCAFEISAHVQQLGLASDINMISFIF